MTAALDAIRARDARVPEEFWAAVARDEDGLMVAVQDRHALLAALDRAEAVATEGYRLVKWLVDWEGLPVGRRERADLWLLDVEPALRAYEDADKEGVTQ